jgi:hypothetical protein
MSLLLLFRPEPTVPHGPENPDVELDTFLTPTTSPLARVDAIWGPSQADANNPTAHAFASDPTAGVVV